MFDKIDTIVDQMIQSLVRTDYHLLDQLFGQFIEAFTHLLEGRYGLLSQDQLVAVSSFLSDIEDAVVSRDMVKYWDLLNHTYTDLRG